MVSNDELSQELCQLRSNADNLSRCLHALLERIGQLEGLTGEDVSGKGRIRHDDGSEEPTTDEQVIQHDQVSVDPETGLKKRTIVTERILTTKTFAAVPKGTSKAATVTGGSPLTVSDAAPSPSPQSARSPTSASKGLVGIVENGAEVPRSLLGTAYETRVVTVKADVLKHIDVEVICGELVVTKVSPSTNGLIRPGDTISEINGKPAKSLKNIFCQVGDVQVKLVVSDIYNAPVVFVKALDNYDSEKDPNQPNAGLAMNVRRGEVLQVLSSDKDWLQARKVNDMSQCAFVPASLPTMNVSMLSPYGRRTLVLLGAPGVGRRTLKSMLLGQLPNHFATVVPVTTRPQRSGEQEGRDYHFETRENVLKLIRSNELVEWGELNNVMYGTSAESVRRVVRSGRVCVLDCSAKALKYLYSREFMPFVVVIAPPSLEELREMTKLRPNYQNRNEEELKATIDHHQALMSSEFAKYFDQVLVNRNHDITFRRLLETLERLRNNAQWVPVDWMT